MGRSARAVSWMGEPQTEKGHLRCDTSKGQLKCVRLIREIRIETNDTKTDLLLGFVRRVGQVIFKIYVSEDS